MEKNKCCNNIPVIFLLLVISTFIMHLGPDIYKLTTTPSVPHYAYERWMPGYEFKEAYGKSADDFIRLFVSKSSSRNFIGVNACLKRGGQLICQDVILYNPNNESVVGGVRGIANGIGYSHPHPVVKVIADKSYAIREQRDDQDEYSYVVESVVNLGDKFPDDFLRNLPSKISGKSGLPSIIPGSFDSVVDRIRHNFAKATDKIRLIFVSETVSNNQWKYPERYILKDIFYDKIEEFDPEIKAVIQVYLESDEKS